MTTTEHPPAADPGAHAAGDDEPPRLISAQEAEAEREFEAWVEDAFGPLAVRGTVLALHFRKTWMEAWRLARHAAFLQVEDAIRRAKVAERVAAEVAREGER